MARLKTLSKSEDRNTNFGRFVGGFISDVMLDVIKKDEGAYATINANKKNLQEECIADNISVGNQILFQEVPIGQLSGPANVCEIRCISVKSNLPMFTISIAVKQ